MSERKGLITFVKTKRTKEELATALAVLKDFKKCESTDEYLEVMFSAWVKLEQYEEFLEHLVNDKPLEADSLEEYKRVYG